MAIVMTSAPALEPVTLSEAKDHLRLDGSAEDVLVQSLILTSRLHVEAALGLALISQGWRLTLDRVPETDTLMLPLRPVAAITAIRIFAADGSDSVMPADDYALDGSPLDPRLVRRAAAWPIPGRARSGIAIDLTAGYGPDADDVPEPIRHAIRLLVAHWYEHRDPFEVGSAGARIPAFISEMLMPYRGVRL